MGKNRSSGRVRNSSSTRNRLYKWMESMKAVLIDNIGWFYWVMGPQLSCWTHCLVYSYFLGLLYRWCCIHFNCVRLLHEMTIQSHLPWRAALYKGKFHDLSRFWPSCLGLLYCCQRLELFGFSLFSTVSVPVEVYYGDS